MTKGGIYLFARVVINFSVVKRCDVKFNGKTENRAFRLTIPEDYGPESSLGPSTSSLGLGNDCDIRRHVADLHNTIVESEVPPSFYFEEAKNELASINPTIVREKSSMLKRRH